MFRKIKVLLILWLLVIGSAVCTVPDLCAAGRFSVVIDPAHGGEDSGVKITDKIGEKDITLAIALALQKELQKESDFSTTLTRVADKTVTPEDRRKAVLGLKPDLFLSLHINGGFGKNAAGFELYYPGFKTIADQQGKKKDAATEVRSKYLNESVRLAQIIQKNLDALFPRKGRGLREAETPAIEGMNIPAVVVEVGFATNPDERKQLLSPDGQAEIAKALAKSIKLYFR
jgi:N-acetylmuramoyl-L-alanine amidase